MKVGINIQSYVDVITNSSTTVFCSIESDFETIIQNIEDYLNSFLPFKVKYHRSCIIKTYSITFEVEYGENEELTENICALIEQLLSEHFPNGGYFVTSGYSITDIVTNSSTEVFIRVKETAINTVKELINDLLKISGSTLQADDLFTIEILYDDSSDLMVTPKQDTTECIEAAVILSSLRSLFNYEVHEDR